MGNIKVRIFSRSNSHHLSPLFTGLEMLRRGGLIDLSQEVCPRFSPNPQAPPHLRDAQGAHLKVVINDKTRVLYDVHDSYEIAPQDLDDVDFYFKRSYRRDAIPAQCRDRVFPLGLNYSAAANRFSALALQRSLFLNRGIRRLEELLRHFPGYRAAVEPIRLLECLPPFNMSPRVLFMTRLWNPEPYPGIPQAKVEEVMGINETRIQCIRLLKKEFGDTFFGGLEHSDFAAGRYPDLLVQPRKITLRKHYVRLVKSFPICIATTGLHGSIGWKFAEYVAMSRAIVSEKLHYECPGGLESGKNYLPFASPEECVDVAARLLGDRDLRLEMAKNNLLYYRNFARPDALVLQSLLTCLLRGK
jgi:hypothetical protein